MSKSNQEKRKRDETSPAKSETNKKQNVLSNYWLHKPAPTPISNRFEALQQVTTDKDMIVKPKETKPPPIFVDGVENIKPLSALLDEVAQKDYQMKILNKNEIRITLTTSETYSKVTKALEEKNTQFHTYQLKKDRCFKVVLRGLHPSTDPKEISDSLEILGHKVINIHNVKQKTTRTALPLFYVDIKNNDNNKEIYEILFLLHTKIIIEPFKAKKIIPQCSNCQRYNHTKAFCHRSPRCVKCAGGHNTSNCNRTERSESVKCVLCNGNHPANYKGCAVYRETYQKMYPTPRIKTFTASQPQSLPLPLPLPLPSPLPAPPTPKPSSEPRKSYSNAVKGRDDDNQNETIQLTSLIHELMSRQETMLNKFMEGINSLTKLISALVSKI